MKKTQKACLAAFLLSIPQLGMFADNKDDLTAEYLQNPSFEANSASSLSPVNNSADGLRGYTLKNPSGWTVSGTEVTELLVNKDCYTDNNFGKVTTIPNGQYAYYLRQGWSTGSTTLTQSVTLPAGKYRFSVDERSAFANSATSILKLVAGSESSSVSFVQGSAGCFTSMAWNTQSLNFELAKETKINLGVTIDWQSGGSCVMLDNVRLYDASNYVEPQDPTEESVISPTEGVIDNLFVDEPTMKADLLGMLARFSTYLVNDFQECQQPNSLGEACGAFKGENTMGNNEQGVRPNADLSMICAFLVKYGKPAGISLPAGVTWQKIEDMAMKSLVFAYSTHKANKLKVCSGNNYWGSTSTSDVAWESSLWAMSVAYSAYFQWDKLSEKQRNYIYQMLKAECNYELQRGIPTGYSGDTKAEENGWEADILAATLGLFPNDALAPKWFQRLREFAINSYSHPSDATNETIIDPDYDKTTIADLYKGQNLYDDYTLQNHNLFHTSYQNVVMQELGEAALAMKMFQLGLYGEEKWKTNALMHHNQEVQDSVLNWLALADGELAMPNGNDWSLFLYDQITSYTTQACFQRDANALMMENMAYKYIKARQQTTNDGTWLLRADVGARRMGVEAHRVMMTYLMHDVLSTADLKPTNWDDFNEKFAEAKILPCQNIVRAASKDRFTTFSWSNGLKSYTGYIASNSPDKNKIIVPFRANNTGNFLGWYEVSGKGTNATPVVSGVYQLKGNAYVMNGELNTNDGTLNNRFAIYSTPGNAVIYLDHVKANSAATITAEKGGLMAISVDEMTKLARTLYYSDGTSAIDNEKMEVNPSMKHKQLDGKTFTQLSTDWVNIDNAVGIVGQNTGKGVAFGDRANNNSIMTAKLYPLYNNQSRTVKAGDVVDARNLVYYSNQDAVSTKLMATQLLKMQEMLPEGWNGVIASDKDCGYLLVSNFRGTTPNVTLKDITFLTYAPVFGDETLINGTKATATLKVAQNNSYAQPITIMIDSKDMSLTARQESESSAYITAAQKGEFTAVIALVGNERPAKGTIQIKAGETLRIYLDGDKVAAEVASVPTPQPNADLTDKIVNPTFDGNTSAGWSGTAPSFQSYTNAEFYNKTFDFYQEVEGLEPGYYELGVQAFYRDGTYANAATRHKNGTETLKAQLSANDSTMAVCSIFADTDKNYKVGVKTTAGYVPDNMEQAASYFRKGLYQNTLLTSVGEDGKMTIRLKKTSTTNSDWTCFDNFTLKYIGKENPVDPTVGLPSVPSAAALNADENVYDLGGRRTHPSNHGIHIINKKKILKK